MWLRHNSELTSQALVDRLFRVFDVRVTTSYMSKVRKALGWCTRTLQYCQLISHKTNCVEYSGHWMHLDPKKQLIKSYLLIPEWILENKIRG
jgi:hypothetical protein